MTLPNYVKVNSQQLSHNGVWVTSHHISSVTTELLLILEHGG